MLHLSTVLRPSISTACTCRVCGDHMGLAVVSNTLRSVQDSACVFSLVLAFQWYVLTGCPGSKALGTAAQVA